MACLGTVNQLSKSNPLLSHYNRDIFFYTLAKGVGTQERARIHTGKQSTQVRKKPAQVGENPTQMRKKPAKAGRGDVPGFEP